MINESDDIHNLMEQFLRHYIKTMISAVKLLNYGGAPQDMRVLFLVTKEPGISIGDIVNELGRDKSQITRKVKDLETKGLLKRIPHENDKRVSTLHITEAGRKIALELQKVKQDVLNDVLSSLTKEEKAQFQALLKKLVGGAYGW
ncbi:MAG: MarR family winged helix-turn-helix transcriptional regulator [Alcanivorax sp.]